MLLNADKWALIALAPFWTMAIAPADSITIASTSRKESILFSRTVASSCARVTRWSRIALDKKMKHKTSATVVLASTRLYFGPKRKRPNLTKGINLKGYKAEPAEIIDIIPEGLLSIPTVL